MAADPEATGRLMPGMFPEARGAPPEGTVPGPDATDGPPHGRQEGRFLHGYYGHCRCLPLHVTCGGHVPFARLRPPDIDASDGALEGLARIVAVIRGAWPSVRIAVRGDSGFRRDGTMAWRVAGGVDSVSGLARSPRLERRAGRRMRRPRSRCVATGEPSRRFTGSGCRTPPAWSRRRRVVARAGALPGPRGGSPRLTVTGLPGPESGSRAPCGDLHRARGDMENRTRERRLELFADRTPAAAMRASQLRVYLPAFAGMPGRTVRAVGPAGTDLARARPGTIRARLPKVRVAVPLFALCSRFRSHRRPADAAAGRDRMTGRIGAGCPDSRSGEISGLGIAEADSPLSPLRLVGVFPHGLGGSSPYISTGTIAASLSIGGTMHPGIRSSPLLVLHLTVESGGVKPSRICLRRNGGLRNSPWRGRLASVHQPPAFLAGITGPTPPLCAGRNAGLKNRELWSRRRGGCSACANP